MAKPLTGLGVFGSSTLDSTATLDTNYAAIAAVLNDLNTYSNQVTDTGAANAIVVTSGPNLTATLAFGLTLYVKMAATNTSTVVSLNLNGLGARSVQIAGGIGPPVGSLIAGGMYQFIYDGTNFQAVGIFGAAVFSSNNVWSGTNSFTGAIRTDTTAPYVSLGNIGGSAPSVAWMSSTAAANNRLWFGAVDGLGDWILETSDDAVTTNRVAFQAGRTGAAVTSIILGNTTDKPAITLNGPVTIPAPSSGAALTLAGQVFATGGLTPNAATTQVGMGVRVGLPVLDLINSAAPAGARGYAITSDGSGNLLVIASDDAHVAGQVSFELNQTAGTPTGMKGWGPVAGGLVDMTPDTSTFVAALVGMTAGVNCTVRWVKSGNAVTLRFGAATGTSNSAGMSCAAGTLPASIRPGGGSGQTVVPIIVTDAGSDSLGVIRVVSDGSINFGKGGAPGSGFTASGVKGFGEDSTATYLIN